jgi:uncharacterized protein YndB with AHSA1/START domain
MNQPSFTAEFTVKETPDQVFEAVTRVSDWWTETIEGRSAQAGDEFTFRDEGIRFATFRLTEVEPGRRMVWEVLDSYLNFVDDHGEWTGTRVIFDLQGGRDGTTLHFTHEGLLSTVECYDACSTGWGMCMSSIKRLITTGESQTGPKPR